MAQAKSQAIGFRLSLVDTNQHFASNPYSRDAYNGNYIIGGSSKFREVFAYNRYALNAPRWHNTVLLKRGIHGQGISKIRHQLEIDSLAQTLTWTTIVDTTSSPRQIYRHFVIGVNRPSANYSIQFDTVWQAADISPSASSGHNIQALNTGFLSCELAGVGSMLPYRLPAVIKSDSLYRQYSIADVLRCNGSMDFSKNLLLANVYRGDCQLRIKPHLFYDPITNAMVVEVYNIWGGCRASGTKPLTIMAERPPVKSYHLIFQEIQVDSQREYLDHLRKEN